MGINNFLSNKWILILSFQVFKRTRNRLLRKRFILIAVASQSKKNFMMSLFKMWTLEIKRFQQIKTLIFSSVL